MEKLKKVFSPGHDKDDEVLYGDSKSGKTAGEGSHLASNEPAGMSSAGTHSTVEQPSALAGQDPDLRRHVLNHSSDTTARPAPSPVMSSGSGVADNVSTESIRSGVIGGDEAKATDIGSMDYATGSGGPTSGLAHETTLPDRTAADDQRSFPLSGGSTARPATEGIPTMDPMSTHQHKGRGHTFKGDPCPPGDEPMLSGYPHHFKGPHGTDTANRLDPHVPGEFPAEDGENAQGNTIHGVREETLAGGAAAGATGLAAHEAGKAHDPLTSSTNTYPEERSINPTGSSASVHPSTNDRAFHLGGVPGDTANSEPTSGRDHHLGRDAAIAGGVGAAGLGAYETGAHKHDHDDPLHAPGRFDDQRFDPNAAHSDKPTHIPNLTYGHSTTHGQEPNQHHYGRDAAVVGGAGAAGAAAYGSYAPGAGEAKARQTGPTETDPASKTVGPHKSNVLNVLDPRVLPQPEKMKDSNTSGPYRSDALNAADPRVNAREDPQQSQHHYGRDAALAGGAGAAGVGAYEYGQHHTGPTQEDPASFTTGPHSSNVANVVDPRVQPQPEKMKARDTTGPYTSDSMNRADPRVDSNKDHHYGRDAAIAGGAGAAGLGVYEYGSRRAGPTEEDPASFTTGPHQTNIANIADPRVQPEPEKMKDHHYGRDAAVAGGAGAAGYGAYEAVDHKQEEKLEKERIKEAEKKHQHQLEKEEKERKKAAEKNEKEHEKGEKKHHLLGFLHRDKPKEPEEERELKSEGRLREADQAAHERHQRELEAAAAAGEVPAAGAKFEPPLEEQHAHPNASSPQYVSIDDRRHQSISTDQNGRHRLHKDPPASMQN